MNSLMCLYTDCKATIDITKNISYNYKGRHMKFKHDVTKELLQNGVSAIDYVKSELNSADSLTKPVVRK